MSLPITSIRPPVAIPELPAAAPLLKTGSGFGSVLATAISQVNQVQQSAQSSIDKYLSGEDEEVHKVALATQEAALSFDLFLQVRNKMVSAYQEVMRMQM
jgi:flagellar hook-basal body complex protein FliE